MGVAVEKSFVLFCAGEDSGDILGQKLVETCVNSGLKACGSGGVRMLSAGLQPIVDFEHCRFLVLAMFFLIIKS